MTPNPASPTPTSKASFHLISPHLQTCGPPELKLNKPKTELSTLFSQSSLPSASLIFMTSPTAFQEPRPESTHAPSLALHWLLSTQASGPAAGQHHPSYRHPTPPVTSSSPLCWNCQLGTPRPPEPPLSNPTRKWIWRNDFLQHNSHPLSKRIWTAVLVL